MPFFECMRYVPNVKTAYSVSLTNGLDELQTLAQNNLPCFLH